MKGNEKTWLALGQETISALEQGGISDAQRNATWLLCDVLQCSQVQLFAYPERLATQAQVEKLSEMVKRRLAREPLQYIQGYAEFYGLRFDVSPAVLIPRPETEQVVEQALALLAGQPMPRVLDIGTGSGCISLTLKHEHTDAEVMACDISREALEVAQFNAQHLELEVSFVQADVLAANFTTHCPGPFDLVISNPPYVLPEEAASLEPEVHNFEPHIALFTDDDPLQFYRAIAQYAKDILKPGGFLIFETHAHHGKEVYALLGTMGFVDVQQHDDLAGLPRMVHGQWLANL